MSADFVIGELCFLAAAVLSFIGGTATEVIPMVGGPVFGASIVCVVLLPILRFKVYG